MVLNGMSNLKITKICNAAHFNILSRKADKIQLVGCCNKIIEIL